MVSSVWSSVAFGGFAMCHGFFEFECVAIVLDGRRGSHQLGGDAEKIG